VSLLSGLGNILKVFLYTIYIGVNHPIKWLFMGKKRKEPLEFKKIDTFAIQKKVKWQRI
jgi:hypothetical protein